MPRKDAPKKKTVSTSRRIPDPNPTTSTTRNPKTEGGYFDKYGRERRANGQAYFEFDANPQTRLTATDGHVVCELSGKPRYPIPGLRTFGPRMSDVDDNNNPLPSYYFITSPNMTTVPDIFRDPFSIQVRQDGRFGTSDFTIFPQWYAEGTYYLPYVRRKPTPENLANDPYTLLWYSMSNKDFVPEQGSIDGGMGRLSSSLANSFATLRKEFMAKIKVEVISGKHTSEELKELTFCERGMQFASIALMCAPQRYEGVVTVTSFQRYFLETLACYEYLTHWKTLEANQSDEPRVAAHVIGTLTHDIQLAIEFFDLGVPVWLVRHPEDFALSTIVQEEVYPSPEPTDMPPMKGSAIIWSGPAGAFRNRVCQSLRMGNIHLGHSAYQALPGRFITVANQNVILAYETLPGAQVTSGAVPEPMATNLTSSQLQNSSSLVASSSGSQFHTSRVASSSSYSSSIALSSSSHSSSSIAASSSGSLRPIVPASAPVRAFQIAVTKFQVPVGPLAPIINQVWLWALRCVEATPSRVAGHPDRTLLRGYALPDPHAFLNSKSRLALYIAAWLLIRPAWMHEATNRGDDKGECAPYPEPQDWKNFLVDLFGKMRLKLDSSGVGTSMAPTTVKQREKKRKLNLITGAVSKFKIDTSDFTSPSDVFWHGQLLLSKDALRNFELTISDKVAREVIWELTNNNFALELLATDRVRFPRHGLSEDEGMDHDARVAACFPEGILISMDYPRLDKGLGAAHWRDRCEYVEAFRLLLSSWGGRKALELGEMFPIMPTSSERDVEDVESVAYAFYCQKFFDFFGRAPCVPGHLPRD